MKRTNESRRIVDLGRASRETKGAGFIERDVAGLKVGTGLSTD
ncbi:benenodin family lasso peptide [Sphingomonas sp. SUN019]|nr:benenodin family lasso peptide [Sphingomonas sp. SUN019]UVO50146.1 benenodin family lasso peptide [Sphingomonas sp. SUN019]